MTRDEFIQILKENAYSYKIEGDNLVVINGNDYGTVWLDSLTSLPSGVVFENGGKVWLNSLTSLPSGVVFENEGGVDLSSLTSIPSGVEFKNGGNVYLESLTSIPSGVEFKNKGDVGLDSLTGDRFDEWKGNIKVIDSKRLLNLMISKGIFER